MEEAARVRLSRVGRHAVLTFLSPEAGPPVVTIGAIKELCRLTDDLAADPDIRSVTLESAGDTVFLAGGDLVEFATLDTAEKGREMAEMMRSALATLENLPCLVMAAVSGDAYGGGCETILAADVRVACEGVRFSFTQGRFGVITGWGGATRLSHLVGPGRAMWLLATGQPIEADEACRIGLVDKVVPRDRLDDMIAEVRASTEMLSPESIRAAKLAVLGAVSLPREHSMKAELDLFCGLWASPGHMEGLRAFFEHRAPSWVK